MAPLHPQVPDYHEHIDRPMDFGTMKTNLKRGVYRCVSDLRAHVELVFSNAFHYNPENSPERRMAFELQVRCALNKPLLA